MVNKQEIIDLYNVLCDFAGRTLSREEYRGLETRYSSSLIEMIWGSWNNFTQEAAQYLNRQRTDITLMVDKKINDIVITQVTDGSNINFDFFDTLLNYCDKTKSNLYILWGKALYREDIFTTEVYESIKPYLCTKLILEKDKSCLIKDFNISATHKNPLLNIDKLSTSFNTVIVGSSKQHLQILPYKNYNPYRVACSTGTISLPDYKENISGYLDEKNHCYGAIKLTYDEKQKRYIVRNLNYENGYIYDLNAYYDKTKIYSNKEVECMVLGDLHLPEEDEEAYSKSLVHISKLKPKTVVIHDVASWNSISHHEQYKYLTKVKNKTAETFSLELELNCVLEKLKALATDFPNIQFKIVNSNHDDFINKWLDNGEFVKDSINAKIGAKLYIDYLENKNILTTHLPKNISFIPKNTSFSIQDYELSEHGDSGISGASGSINAFNKSFDKIIIGHTHSPQIHNKTIVVGTLSKLVLNYNTKGMTKWAHANCIIYKNGSFQLIFL